MPFTIVGMGKIFLSDIKYLALSFLVVFGSVSSSLASEEIELPEDELAKESVLPVFDKTVVVRNRAVSLSKRFELSANMGLNLLEPFYSNIVYGFGGAYHFDETHGVNVSFILQQTDLSSNAKDLQAGKGLNSGSFDASLAPTIDSLLFINYQMTAYYGKISVTKQSAMNLSLYGLAGLGLVNWSDSTEPALNVGFGQKLYFNKHFAFRADLNMAIYQGPDITSKDLPAGGAKRNSDYFDSTLFFRTYLTAGIAYLF